MESPSKYGTIERRQKAVEARDCYIIPGALYVYAAFVRMALLFGAGSISSGTWSSQLSRLSTPSFRPAATKGSRGATCLRARDVARAAEDVWYISMDVQTDAAVLPLVAVPLRRGAKELMNPFGWFDGTDRRVLSSTLLWVMATGITNSAHATVLAGPVTSRMDMAQDVMPGAREHDTDSVQGLVRGFLQAEREFDETKLRALIADDYVEVSPAGEVDEHDRFLSFYAKGSKVESPPMTLAEARVRFFGGTQGAQPTSAIEIVTISYSMKNQDGTPRTLSIRATYVAHREARSWKLISAQFTAVRP